MRNTAVVNKVELTDDPLKNIFIMAPHLDESGQNRVFGLMCGLIRKESSQESNDSKLRG